MIACRDCQLRRQCSDRRAPTIDPATRQVTRKIAVGAAPIQLFATDSRTMPVANQGTRNKPGKKVLATNYRAFGAFRQGVRRLRNVASGTGRSPTH